MTLFNDSLRFKLGCVSQSIILRKASASKALRLTQSKIHVKTSGRLRIQSALFCNKKGAFVTASIVFVKGFIPTTVIDRQ